MDESVFFAFAAGGLWPGVGKGLAEEMTKAGITGPAQVTVTNLAALPRVTERRASRLFTSWIGAGQAYALAEMLIPEEIPTRWVTRLMEAIGDNAADLLAKDPWRLLALPDALVPQADRLARAIDPTVRRDDPRRGRALVGWTLARFARDGHTASSAREVAAGLRPFGADGEVAITAALDMGDVVEVADPTVDPSAELDEDAQEQIDTEQWIATLVLAEAEDAVAEGLARLQSTAKPVATAKQVAAACKGLDAVQSGAIALAAEHGVSLLTGGPGTGKSRTIAAVVSLCDEVGISLALAAPTGRAAKRLEELAGSAAMTVHRLLGARGGDGGAGRFDHDADNQIEFDLVVVDEASMMDAELAAALIEAIPDGTHLVIVGDPAQLPSIGAGRVLGDLIDSGALPMTELSTLYRQTEGGAIARLATAVRSGSLPSVQDPTHEVVIVPARGSGEAAHRVVQLVTDSIPRVFGAPSDQIQVVTPVHKGDAGTQSLNRALKAALNPGRGVVRGFDQGDRVVATANHLDAEPTGYANGEVGMVVSTGDNSLRVAFSTGESEISGKALNDLLHGWAITVHRAQGSEWEAVVAVMPPEAGNMLSRPLVYTALTRARHHLSVVHAAGPGLARAVEQIGEKPRRTRLQQLTVQAIHELG